MTEIEYFTFKITKKGWHISYPDGSQKRHNIDKINNNLKKEKIMPLHLFDENFKLGDIKDSFILKKRKC